MKGTQQTWVVLNTWARTLVNATQEIKYIEVLYRYYPKTGWERSDIKHVVMEPSIKKESTGRVYLDGLGGEYALQQYTLPDGRVLHEEVQHGYSFGDRGEIWIVFLALADADNFWVADSYWKRQEMNLQVLGDAQLVWAASSEAEKVF